jgi:hypothetical protein
LTYHTGITLRRADNAVPTVLSKGKKKDQNCKWEKNISNNRQSVQCQNDDHTGKRRRGWLMLEHKMKTLNAFKVETKSLVNEPKLYNSM